MGQGVPTMANAVYQYVLQRVRPCYCGPIRFYAELHAQRLAVV